MPRQPSEPADLRTQGGRLRWARERLHIPSIRAAAIKFGWNENTYKSHEQGTRGAEGVKTRHLEKYARAYRVSLSWLATGTGDPLKPDLTADDLEAVRKVLRAINE